MPTATQRKEELLDGMTEKMANWSGHHIDRHIFTREELILILLGEVARLTSGFPYRSQRESMLEQIDAQLRAAVTAIVESYNGQRSQDS